MGDINAIGNGLMITIKFQDYNMSHYILHLHKGKECKVFDFPMSAKKHIEIGEIIAINEVYYKVYDVQHRFQIRGGNNLMPFEIKVTARDKDEELEYRSVYANINRMERAIHFFQNVHPLLNTGHSLQSAYEKLYNE